MNKRQTPLFRFYASTAVILALMYNPQLMLQICGPFTHPLHPKPHLIALILLMELFRISFPQIVTLAAKVPLLTQWMKIAHSFITVKYLCVLFIKLFLVFENEHRKKFYLHTCLLEGTIIVMCVLLDCFNRPNISEAGELLLVEGLHRLAIVYELTQTFCPNLILYYLVFDLLSFILAQCEGQALEGLKTSLFVKHDVYRFMVMLLGYYGIVGVAQLTTHGPKTLLGFLFSFRWWWLTLGQYNQRQFGEASGSLLKAGGVVVMVECFNTFLSM